MFDKQYRFTGTHAEKVNALTSVFDEAAKAKLFDRNLDVYINAPIVGFLHKRKGIKNTDSTISDQNIFPEQMMNSAELLKYILRLILILDSENEPCEEKRMDKASELLCDKGRTVDEVISVVGYSDRKLFYKHFKDTFGMTPKEFRDMKNNE